LDNCRLLQERQLEIGGALSCQRMLAFLFWVSTITYTGGQTDRQKNFNVFGRPGSG